MKIHILGICGTFMGGLALIARQRGHQVTGSDAAIYPPMSDALRDAGVKVVEDYDPVGIPVDVEQVIVGNAISRGNPSLEHVLQHGIAYTSGPQWLAEQVLHHQHVLAVSGTHGKTTTTSLLTWMLTTAGLNPSYLIGGLAKNFPQTAHYADSDYFVIEADEYDSAFFDKRSKFLHYRPSTLIMNNLEFDHADIFQDLAAIQQQFSILLRTVPQDGLILYPADSAAIEAVIRQGCWTPCETLGSSNAAWKLGEVSADGTHFTFYYQQQGYTVEWKQIGRHNVHNALAAIAAAHHVGVTIPQAIDALQTFEGVKRRMEVLGERKGVTVYDDFAHHPTAIAATLAGLRARVGEQRIVAVLQFGSNTMSDGVHQDTIAHALQAADHVLLLSPASRQWNVDQIQQQMAGKATVYQQVDEILEGLVPMLQPDDHVLIMSNKGFDGIHQRLLDQLAQP